MPTLNIHPELQSLLPPLTKEEYAGLEADILEHGCMSALAVWDTTIVDGHNRYAICQKHGLPFEIKQLEFDSIADAKLWAWQHQTHRRNLSEYQRAEIGLQLKPLIAEQIREKEHLRKTSVQKSGESLRTDDVIAKIADVSKDTVSKVDYLVKNADEDTKERLRQKKTSINKEYKRLKTEEKSKRQPVVTPEPAGDVAVEPEAGTTGQESNPSETPPKTKVCAEELTHVVRTTLQNIRQDKPEHLLINLNMHFRKGYIHDLIVDGMAYLHEKQGSTVTAPIALELAKLYIDGFDKCQGESPKILPLQAADDVAVPVVPESVTTGQEPKPSEQSQKTKVCAEELTHVVRTTLQNIRQDNPEHLLRNLASHFRKGYIDDLVLGAMEFLHENQGEKITAPIALKIAKRHIKGFVEFQEKPSEENPKQEIISPPTSSVEQSPSVAKSDGKPEVKLGLFLKPGEKSCAETCEPYVPRTTLQNIPQDKPDVLLANLEAHFRKGYIEDLVLEAMEFLHEYQGEEVTSPLALKIAKRFIKDFDEFQNQPPEILPPQNEQS